MKNLFHQISVDATGIKIDRFLIDMIKLKLTKKNFFCTPDQFYLIGKLFFF